MKAYQQAAVGVLKLTVAWPAPVVYKVGEQPAGWAVIATGPECYRYSHPCADESQARAVLREIQIIRGEISVDKVRECDNPTGHRFELIRRCTICGWLENANDTHPTHP